MSQEELLTISSSLDIYVYFLYNFVLDRNLPVLNISIVITVTYELKFSPVDRNLHRILKFLKIVTLDLGPANLILLE